MGFYYKDGGGYVGGCTAQILGFLGIVAVFYLHSLGIGIGWSILIVLVLIIILGELYFYLKNKREN